MSELLVLGCKNLGGFQMRGKPVVDYFNAGCLNVEKLAEEKLKTNKPETILLIKYDYGNAKIIRRNCKRLIFDPLDCWSSTAQTGEMPQEPKAFFKFWYNRLGFDDILATGYAVEQVMRDALPKKVRVHLVPHACDPLVRANWYNPEGHVAYAGGPQYLGDQFENIKEACAILKRKFVFRSDMGAVWALRGAALVIAVRLPPTNTVMNCLAKPAVKLENAAAGEMPALASGHACDTHQADITIVDKRVQSAHDWATAILHGLKMAPKLKNPYRVYSYVDAFERMLRE